MARNRWLMAMVGSVLVTLAATAHAEVLCEVPGPQDAAVTRTGKIPGLGDVTGVVGWDNRVTLTLKGRHFEVSRTISPSGDHEIIVTGGGELVPLVIRIGPREGIRVARGANVVWGTSNLGALKAMTEGRAVAAFREQLGEYERRLIDGTPARPDDVHAYGFVLIGSFIASMAGDPVAVGRTRDLIVARMRRTLRAVRADFRDCVSDYEKYLLNIDTQRTSCLESANAQDSWYERASQRLLCEAEFIAGALSGEGQFVSCSALLPLVK